MSTTGIIIVREYVERVKSRSFIVGTALIVGAMFLLALLPLGFHWLNDTFTSRLVVVGPDPSTAAQVGKAIGDAYIVTVSKDASSGETLPADIAAQVKAKKYDAALVAYRTSAGLAFAFYPRQAGTLKDSAVLRSRLVGVAVGADLSGENAAAANRALNFQFKTVPLNERYTSDMQEVAATTLVYVLLIILYTATIIYAIQVAQGVVEEKSNRVMEVLIAAVRPAQLLAGKIFGIGSVALTQMVIFALAAAAALIVFAIVFVSTLSAAEMTQLMHQATAQTNITGVAGVSPNQLAATGFAKNLPTVVYMVVFFLIGFFSYATLSAGIGALCSRSEDVQQLNGVMMVPIILAYFVAILALSGDPDKPLIVIASFIPLLSPMVMFTRVALTSVPPWQIALSIALSLAAIWGLTLLAGKLYRVGLLMYGKAPKLGDVWRALRAPA